MSDNNTDEPAGPVTVTLELPAGLVRAYDALVEAAVYPDRESAILHGLVESYRHNMGSFHTVRVDLDWRRDEQDREAEAAQADDATDEDAPDSPES
jgi:hypothetical protein